MTIGPPTTSTDWTSRLVSLVREIRPDWDGRGIRAALVQHVDRPLAEVTAAAVAAASNPKAQLPVAIGWAQHWPGQAPSYDSSDPAHWRERCPVHLTEINDNGLCRDCEGMRKGVDPDQPEEMRCRRRDCLMHGVGRYHDPEEHA